MLWIAIGLTAVIGVVVVTLVLARRSHRDLGSVSVHWLTEHRTDR
jgi:hypothetical protein